MPSRRVKVFFDGGCRPNPGPIEAAVVLRGVTHVFDDLGVGSNSDAEWRALVCALELAQSAGLANVELIGDAREVIGQANLALSGAAVSGATVSGGHAAAFLSVAAKGRPARIRWIKREQNLAGIALASRHPR